GDRAEQLERGGTVASLADHRHVRLRLQDHAEPRPHQFLVVDEQDPDAHATPAGAGASGNVATTSNPPPGRGPAATEPPYIATRSRIPVRPCPVAAGIAAPPGSPRPSSLIASTSASWQ